MKTYVIENMPVTAPGSIEESEVRQIVAEEKVQWAAAGKQPGRCELYFDDEEQLCIRTTEKSPIKRVRRITGYLSNMENFNDSKLDELQQRTSHA